MEAALAAAAEVAAEKDRADALAEENRKLIDKQNKLATTTTVDKSVRWSLPLPASPLSFGLVFADSNHLLQG